jgi:hypothetical protein
MNEKVVALVDLLHIGKLDLLVTRQLPMTYHPTGMQSRR